jgi:hypothetical protein
MADDTDTECKVRAGRVRSGHEIARSSLAIFSE